MLGGFHSKLIRKANREIIYSHFVSSIFLFIKIKFIFNFYCLHLAAILF
jgi:hypothetical protein